MTPLKPSETTPIENKLSPEDLVDIYVPNRWRIAARQRSIGLSPIRFYKILFGRQSRCINGEFRYWVWETPQYILYVSNIKGELFEVRADVASAEEALDIWVTFFKDLYNRLAKL